MDNGKSILFSRGIKISNKNGNIDKTEYEAVYSGNDVKMLLNNNDKRYYIEADENDIAELLNQPVNKDNLPQKLKKLMKKTRKIHLKPNYDQRTKLHVFFAKFLLFNIIVLFKQTCAFHLFTVFYVEI